MWTLKYAHLNTVSLNKRIYDECYPRASILMARRQDLNVYDIDYKASYQEGTMDIDSGMITDYMVEMTDHKVAMVIESGHCYPELICDRNIKKEEKVVAAPINKGFNHVKFDDMIYDNSDTKSMLYVYAYISNSLHKKQRVNETTETVPGDDFKRLFYGRSLLASDYEKINDFLKLYMFGQKFIPIQELVSIGGKRHKIVFSERIKSELRKLNLWGVSGMCLTDSFIYGLDLK